MIVVPWGESVAVGPIELHLFGLFVGIGVACAVELLRRQLASIGVRVRTAYLVGLAVVLAGFVGARINYLLEHPPADGWGSAAIAGAGLTWYGGAIAGVLALVACARLTGMRVLDLADSLAAPAALGLAIGRIGCLAAADGDFGRPTDLPWATAWPHGVVPTTTESLERHFDLALPGPADRLWGVHPAPLYELVPLLVLAALLVRLAPRLRRVPGTMLAAWAVVAGLARLLVEEVRLNDPVALGLTTPQLWSLAQVLVGLAVFALVRRAVRRRAAAVAT